MLIAELRCVRKDGLPPPCKEDVDRPSPGFLVVSAWAIGLPLVIGSQLIHHLGKGVRHGAKGFDPCTMRATKMLLINLIYGDIIFVMQIQIHFRRKDGACPVLRLVAMARFKAAPRGIFGVWLLTRFVGRQY